MRMRPHGLALVLLSVVVWSQCGCAVPQPPGNGECMRLVEPETQTGYWLYLPEDYVASNGKHPNNERWPVVLTLHGLKPYDNANPQIRSWQQEADRYGFIVIAPELRTCDSLTMQYPLRDRNLSYVREDDEAITAIMDDVFQRTNADPARVLATSFSSGGYMANLLINAHPERFCCLAVMGSNFNEELLDTSQVPKYRRMPIGIFFGENDFNDCRKQSMRAVEWYRRYRFDVEAKKVAGLGHQRRPQTAAAFFASSIGVTPKTPPDLGSLVMQEVLPETAYHPASRRPLEHRPIAPSTAAPPAGAASPGANPQSTATHLMYSPNAPSPGAGRNPPVAVAPAAPPARAPTPAPGSSQRTATPKRPLPQPYSDQSSGGSGGTAPQAPAGPAGRIVVHGKTVGLAPMWVKLSIDMPPDVREGASVLWIDNGRPFGTGMFDAQSVLWEPGEHAIEARVTLADDTNAILRETITVLTAPSSRPANS